MISRGQVHNLSRQLGNPARVGYCESFLCRLRGLMFRSRLGEQDGLLLVGNVDSRWNASIHMFFVPFDLAVFWINARWTVVDKVLAKSWHPAYLPGSSARYILEIHPDRWADYEIGDKVEFREFV